MLLQTTKYECAGTLNCDDSRGLVTLAVLAVQLSLCAAAAVVVISFCTTALLPWEPATSVYLTTCFIGVSLCMELLAWLV